MEVENKAVLYAHDELFCLVRAVLVWKELFGQTTSPLCVRLAQGVAGKPAKLSKYRLTAKVIKPQRCFARITIRKA